MHGLNDELAVEKAAKLIQLSVWEGMNKNTLYVHTR